MPIESKDKLLEINETAYWRIKRIDLIKFFFKGVKFMQKFGSFSVKFFNFW